ncbi:MAG: hypothetical protein M1819_004948 [Sarea resinae]|nr:MAG: hypothetical protein M1819_004948 [Sarea resinae]
MSAISPAMSNAGNSHDPNDPQFGDSEYGSGESNSNSKSPLAYMNFGFLKNLTEKKTKVDGQPAKRRGPKPDSKPAATRRQELNRQAQRTHRERKELYIKALEQEVLRLKETFNQTARERDAAIEEARLLKAILAKHGIPFPGNENYGQGLIGGSSTSSGAGETYSRSSQSASQSPPIASLPAQVQPGATGPQQTAIDYDQIGIDFVLTLERPCMDHMQFLLVRAQDSAENDSDGNVSGHTLMASCPPQSHIINHPDVPHTKEPEMRPSDLQSLLDASKRIQWEGEIPPINAWAMLFTHPRRHEFTVEDIEGIKLDLTTKIRCYGFGAVLEQFEVSDALSSVLANKAPLGRPHQISPPAPPPALSQ